MQSSVTRRSFVQTGFADELASGKIAWQVVNYESPGNGHYATDYEVVAANVVLVMFKDGNQVKWKALPEVWEHVGDKAAFFSFVQTNLREFLGAPMSCSSACGRTAAPGKSYGIQLIPCSSEST